MCAKKVSSSSGDVRRALQMCRRAVEILINDREQRLHRLGGSRTISIDQIKNPHEQFKEETLSLLDKDGLFKVVDMVHVICAAKELNENLSILAVQKASTLEHIFLLAVIKQSHITNEDDLEFSLVWEKFCDLFKSFTFNVGVLMGEGVRVGNGKIQAIGKEKENIQNKTKISLPSRRDMFLLCQRLGKSRILYLDQRKDEREPRICFGMDQTDLKAALLSLKVRQINVLLGG